MAIARRYNDADLNIEIGHEENKEWSSEKLSLIKAFIRQEPEKRTDLQKQRTELLFSKYDNETFFE